MSDEPFKDAIGEDSDISREQGGSPVDMVYNEDGSRLKFVSIVLESP